MAESRARNAKGFAPTQSSSRVAGQATSAQRRPPRALDSPIEKPVVAAGTRGRRLTADERRALQERRRAREQTPTTQVQQASVPAHPPSRPAPTMPRRKDAGEGASRGLIALGTVLIAALTVLAFAGGRLFGSIDDDPPTTMPAMIGLAGTLPATPAGSPVVNRALAIAATPAVTERAVAAVAAAPEAPVVCLDPGHGGDDRGFQRRSTELAPAMDEAVIVLQHAWDLEARLKQAGFNVVMTRRTDVAVNAEGADVNGDRKTGADDQAGNDRYATLDELQARIDICNEANADLLVSMHVNGYSTSTPHGFETWYTRERDFGDRNAAFATLAYRGLKDQLANIGYVLPQADERGVLPDTTADVQNEHSMFKHFVITGPEVPQTINPSQMPGAIVEALFLSNEADAAVLASPAGRAAIVSGYETAIIDYFERFPPESGETTADD